MPDASVTSWNLERSGATDEPWWAPAARGVRYLPIGKPWTREVRFQAPLVEMGTYLPWLRDRFTAAGGRVVRRRVDRLEEALVEAPVVVNATGLAAGALCGDPDVHPARGQIVLVANLGVFVSVRDEGEPGTYVHPRSRDVVLGGTWQEGDGGEGGAAAGPPRRATRRGREVARRDGGARVRARRRRCDAVLGLRRRGGGPGAPAMRVPPAGTSILRLLVHRALTVCRV